MQAIQVKKLEERKSFIPYKLIFTMITDEQKQKIKAENDNLIKQKGYRVNDWLPILDTPKIRSTEEIKGRMSVMNALINIAFEAPVIAIKTWLEEQELSKYLSGSEIAILEKQNEQLEEAEVISLSWYIEALWAFMWVTEMTEQLEAEIPVGDNQASLLPNLEQDEDNSKIADLKNLRSETAIYKMLDYYYRLHWYCVDERLNGRKAKLNEGQIYERRKALEWVFNRSADWDDVEMGT